MSTFILSCFYCKTSRKENTFLLNVEMYVTTCGGFLSPTFLLLQKQGIALGFFCSSAVTVAIQTFRLTSSKSCEVLEV